MDRNGLVNFIDNILETCNQKAKQSNLSPEQTTQIINERLAELYNLLGSYNKGVVDQDTQRVFAEKVPSFIQHLEAQKQQEEMKKRALLDEREQLMARLKEIDSFIQTKPTETKNSSVDPCSRGRGISRGPGC